MMNSKSYLMHTWFLFINSGLSITYFPPSFFSFGKFFLFLCMIMCGFSLDIPTIKQPISQSSELSVFRFPVGLLNSIVFFPCVRQLYTTVGISFQRYDPVAQILTENISSRIPTPCFST